MILPKSWRDLARLWRLDDRFQSISQEVRLGSYRLSATHWYESGSYARIDHQRPVVRPPYDGSQQRRRYWKKVRFETPGQ